MRIDITSQFSVPPHPDVPYAVHNKAVEHQSSSQLAQVKRLQKQATQRKRVTERFDERLRSLLGPKLYKTYTAYLAAQHEVAEKRLGRGKDQESLSEERKKLEAEGAEAAEDFARKHGIDPNKIQGLVDRMISDFGDMRDDAPARGVAPGETVHAAGGRAAGGKKTGGKKIGSPWQVFRPPFAGWSWYNTWNLQGYEFSPTLYLNAGTGLIGNGNRLFAPRNEGGIYGEAEYNTAISFWYQVPATGLLDVSVELKVVSNHSSSSMRWEYIFPWSFPSGRSESRALISFKADGTSPGAWQASWASGITQQHPNAPSSSSLYYFVPGRSYYFNFVDARTFRAGTWVLIHVGSRTNTLCRTNQIFATCDANLQWLVQAVHVRSTGG